MGRGRVQSREFKLSVVRQSTTGQKRPAPVWREPGLAESLLLRWRHEDEARGEAAFGPVDLRANGTLAQKVAELRR